MPGRKHETISEISVQFVRSWASLCSCRPALSVGRRASHMFPTNSLHQVTFAASLMALDLNVVFLSGIRLAAARMDHHDGTERLPLNCVELTQ
mmetsp:Transcript_17666/g.42332  ORF Transcript_17666/g.42332 Transcript_17666/m.42332 type:complete len:93 (+) Transcript_17666:333-611(+)